MSTTAGDIGIDQEMMAKLSPELHQAKEALGRCIDRFEMEPIPPSSAPPAVQVAVTAALKTLFEECVKLFRGSEEKIGKLCEDVDTARAEYAAMDEEAAANVTAPINDDTTKNKPDEKGTPAGDEKKPPAEEKPPTDEKKPAEETPPAEEPPPPPPATSITDPVTPETAQAASDRHAGVENLQEQLEDWDADPLAQDYANANVEDPSKLVDFTGRRDALRIQADALDAALSADARAAATYTNAQLNDFIKQADQLGADFAALKQTNDANLEVAESEIRIAQLKDDDDRRSSSDD